MNAEIISVGAEVISGDVSNTNASYLSQRLSRLGIRVTRHSAVDDRASSITEALAAAIGRSHLVIFTGGLGPTEDDMTKEVVCNAVGFELVENEASMKRLVQYFENKGEDMPVSNRKQAMFPKQAIIFENTIGTADGCAIESGNQSIIMLPGPPGELQTMFENSVEDYLMDKTDTVVVGRTIKVFGVGESKVAEMIAPYLHQADPTVATYVGKGDIRIKLTTTGDTREECEQRLAKTEDAICRALGKVVYARENITLQEAVVKLLLKKGKKVATAESCTAGMLSEMLTDVSGASQVFEFGVSAYANRVKNEVLGVPEAMLKKHGAVSAQVAEAMAKGAAEKGKADFGIGITGIAGPTGGTVTNPVGTVYLSLYDGDTCTTRKISCNPNSPREKIRIAAVMSALDMLRLYLQDDVQALNSPDEPALAPAVVHRSPEKLDPTIAVEQPEQTKQSQKKKKKKKKWWQSIIPMKGDKPAEVIRKIIMIICLLVCIGSAIYVLDWVGQSLLARWRQDNLSDQFHEISDVSERFKMLQEINPDTVAWLTVPGTKCDNPVVKTTDNKKYLNTSFEGNDSKYGTLFADKDCEFEGPSAPGGLSTNTIVYGHHMKDGAMMGELKKLKDYSFYRKNPVIQFTTLYDKDTVDWKIVSIFIADASTEALKEEFNMRQIEFTNEHGFNIYLNEIRQRSMIDTGVDVKYGDHLLTLSTCTYEFSTARLVVVARRVRDGESSKVDISKTQKNADAVYPKAYFKKGTSGRTVVTPYTDRESANSFEAITSNLPAYSETERPTVSREESSEDKPETDTDQ